MLPARHAVGNTTAAPMIAWSIHPIMVTSTRHLQAAATCELLLLVVWVTDKYYVRLKL